MTVRVSSDGNIEWQGSQDRRSINMNPGYHYRHYHHRRHRYGGGPRGCAGYRSRGRMTGCGRMCFGRGRTRYGCNLPVGHQTSSPV